MSGMQYIPTVLSNALRLFVYLFLRVLPSKLLVYAITITYALYLVLRPLAAPAGTPTSVASNNDTTNASEGDIKTKLVQLEEKRIEVVEINTVGTVAVETTDSVVEVLVAPVKSPWLLRARTLLFSLPTRNSTLNLITALFNTGLVLLVADFVTFPLLHPATNVIFARVGAVEPDAVKISVRYPNPLSKPNATAAAVRVAYRQITTSAPSAWKYSTPLQLTDEDDWVKTLKIAGLWPTTSYEYILTTSNNTVLPYPASPLPFRTAPDSRMQLGSHFRFIASSCVTPNFPYLPFQGNTLKGFDLLAKYLWPAGLPSLSSEAAISSGVLASPSASETTETAPQSADALSPSMLSPVLEVTSSHGPASLSSALLDSHAAASPSTAPTEFMLFLGDFIYADVPYYFGDDKEAYRRLYRRNYNSDSFRKIYEQLPIYHIYDDHEIINNFVGESNGTKAPFVNASSAYSLYNGAANYDASFPGENFYDFRYGDIAFFVMDTRHHRTDLTAGEAETQSMLGDKQLTALYDWLGRVNQTATFKFVVSSVPFTSLWTYEAVFDSWAGYPVEKSAILEAFHSVPNVIVISGDRHEFAAIEFNSPSAEGHPVFEISTSPLSMFYVPFIRTLKPHTAEHVARRVPRVVTLDNGTEVITTIEEEVPLERVQKYIATGNYKWSSFEVDTRDPATPVVHLELMIDGKVAYKHDILGVPVKLRGTMALGALLPQSFKGIFDKIGLAPAKWF